MAEYVTERDVSGDSGVRLRPAQVSDTPAIARVFGNAFDDYRRGFGVDAATLAALWQESLTARVRSTTVATVDDGTEGGLVVGFVVTVRPGTQERYGGSRTAQRRTSLWWQTLGARAFWR